MTKEEKNRLIDSFNEAMDNIDLEDTMDLAVTYVEKAIKEYHDTSLALVMLKLMRIIRGEDFHVELKEK